MVKSKIQQKKNLKKIKKQNKNEFGFLKTKQLLEFEGSERGYYLESSPLSVKKHELVEEVIVVKNKKEDLVETSKKSKFNELASSIIPIFQAENSLITESLEEDLGFFFDSTPVYEKEEEKKVMNVKNEKKKKIIQDESVYIETSEEEDDMLSISSSEDIEIIKSLKDWMKHDGMNQLDIDSYQKKEKKSLDEMDYHLLESICIQDIEQIDKEEELLSFELDFEGELDNVPESLIKNYKGIIREEKDRYNKERRLKKEKKSNHNLLQVIIHEFIENESIQSYPFRNLTLHGQNIILPKLAKLFKLNIVKNLKSTQLEKTINTCIPNSFKQYMNKSIHIKSKKIIKKKEYNSRLKKRIENDSIHGKEVASNSIPLSSNNIGHRMLSAMGWKEGDSIGKDGIKEPIKAYMRANRRGLGS